MYTVRFSEIEEKHIAEVANIYNYYVLNSTATFHIKPFSTESIRGLFFFDDPRHRTYVILYEDKICGYVILSQHKPREAFDDTAEVSIYLNPEYTGKGFGKQAIKYIEEIARLKGFHVLISTICGENEKSIKLFEENRYIKCAHYREVGKKFGRYLDLVAYQKII